MRIQPSRAVAYDVVEAVTVSDAYANLLLPTAIARAGLSESDSAFATELTYGTLRGMGTYDAVIEMVSGRSLERIDTPALVALRLGLHQLLSMRTADHAAVSESVELVRKHHGRSPVGFVNAILREVSRHSTDYWFEQLDAGARSDDERLALRFAHPVWVIRALRRALKADGRDGQLEELLHADNVPAAVTMAALPGLAKRPDDREATPMSPLGFRAGKGSPARLVEESGGKLRVQDEGSQLAALALSRFAPVKDGERWLDVCAGPGGKAAILAAEAEVAGAHFEANEVVPARAGLVEDSLLPLSTIVPVHVQDGRTLLGANKGVYDRIMLDAPCTGLGALRRRPEARWRKQPSDVAELAELQRELLSAALEALAPGGTVAYVTCSPHLAETSAVVDECIEKAEYDVIRRDTPRALTEITEGRFEASGAATTETHAQLWPHAHNTDAMFIALLGRPESS